MIDVSSKPHVAVVDYWRFVSAPRYTAGGKLSYDQFAIPGGRTVSQEELELWAKLALKKEIYYLPE